MNSWAPIQPGKLQPFIDGNCAVYRGKFRPREIVRKNGGKIVFQGLAGKAEVWVDGKLLGKKATFDQADFTVALPAGEAEHQINVLIESEPGKDAGFGGEIGIEAVAF